MAAATSTIPSNKSAHRTSRKSIVVQASAGPKIEGTICASTYFVDAQHVVDGTYPCYSTAGVGLTPVPSARLSATEGCRDGFHTSTESKPCQHKFPFGMAVVGVGL